MADNPASSSFTSVPIRINTDVPVAASTISIPATASSSSNSVVTTSTTTTTTATSPRNEFFVSQRAADYELSKIDTLSVEEQEVLANIQELQLQLMQVRVNGGAVR